MALSLGTWLAPVLAAGVPVPAPLVQPVAQRDADAAAPADEGTPEGCFNTWLCYKPPESRTAHPWVADSGIRYVILHDVVTFLTALLPLAWLWAPFAIHFLLVDSDVRPPLEGDILMTIIVHIAISVGIGAVLLPMVFLPFGSIAYSAINIAWHYWITPVTMLHVYDRAMRAAEGGGARRGGRSGADDDEDEDRPRRKKKKRSRSADRDPAAEDRAVDEWGGTPAVPAEPAPSPAQ